MQTAVTSYLTFGGTISVDNLFSGGVKRFLLYHQSDGSFHLLVQQASLSIQNVLSLTADLRYDQADWGFDLQVGASATVLSFGAGLVGDIEDSAGVFRFGAFLVASGLNIQAGPVTILSLGGGFFINPKPEWLGAVDALMNMPASDSIAKKQIAQAQSNASFAMMLYGELSSPPPTSWTAASAGPHEPEHRNDGLRRRAGPEEQPDGRRG